MIRCWFMRRHLTALVDGELSADRAQPVRAHIAACSACAALYRDLESSVVQQRELLPRVLATIDVSTEPLLQQVREQLQREPEPQRPWFLQPAPIVAAVAASLILITFLGVLEPVLIAMGFQDPPEVVVEQPELFRDYALFEHMDAIENFDAVNSAPGRKSGDAQPRG